MDELYYLNLHSSDGRAYWRFQPRRIQDQADAKSKGLENDHHQQQDRPHH